MQIPLKDLEEIKKTVDRMFWLCKALVIASLCIMGYGIISLVEYFKYGKELLIAILCFLVSLVLFLWYRDSSKRWNDMRRKIGDDRL